MGRDFEYSLHNMVWYWYAEPHIDKNKYASWLSASIYGDVRINHQLGTRTYSHRLRARPLVFHGAETNVHQH